MEKTATLNLRINPTVKQRAEDVLTRLGIPMSTAIDMYLNQISLTGGIPFAVTLPKVPSSLNADMMIYMLAGCRMLFLLLRNLGRVIKYEAI